MSAPKKPPKTEARAKALEHLGRAVRAYDQLQDAYNEIEVLYLEVHKPKLLPLAERTAGTAPTQFHMVMTDMEQALANLGDEIVSLAREAVK